MMTNNKDLIMNNIKDYNSILIPTTSVDKFIKILDVLKLSNVPQFSIVPNNEYKDYSYIKFKTNNNTTYLLQNIIDAIINDNAYNEIINADMDVVQYIIENRCIVFDNNDFNLIEENDNKEYYIIPTTYDIISSIIEIDDTKSFYIISSLYNLFTKEKYTIKQVSEIIKNSLNKDNIYFNTLYDNISDLSFILTESKKDLNLLLSYTGQNLFDLFIMIYG